MKKICLIIVLVLISSYLNAQKTIKTIKVHGGKFTRKNYIFHFNLPEKYLNENLLLVDEQSKTYPLQLTDKGEAYGIIDLPADKYKVFKVIKGKSSMSSVELETTQEEMKFLVQGKQVIGFQTGKRAVPPGIDSVFLRGGYIHPIFTPAGTVVSDDYPKNHKHHHGIWAAWTKTQFEEREPDFWNVGTNSAKVVFEQIRELKTGKVFGLLKSKQSYVDKTITPEKKALEEDWEIMVYNIVGKEKPYYIFDLTVTQRCATSSPLKLPEYHYGGVGFRGHDQWDGIENATFLTSEGKARIDGHATRPNWCHIGGKVDGKLAGITMMCHPQNFRAPQPIRIHPHEPFFNYAPSQGGDWAIEPGQTYVAKYRFIVYDGEPDVEEIKRLWNDYSDPVKFE